MKDGIFVSSVHFMDKAILEKHIWPRVQACYAREWDEKHMTPHMHNRMEIMYVVTGSCYIRLYETEKGKETGNLTAVLKETVKLEPGQFIFIDLDVMHELVVREPCYMLNIEMDFISDQDLLLNIRDFARKSNALKNVICSRKQFICGIDEYNQLQYAMEETVKQFDKGAQMNYPLMDVLIARTLLIMADLLQNGQTGLNVIRYMAKIEKYLANCLDGSINEDSLAKYVGISKNYMQRIVREQKGMTLIKYVNRLRIEKAKRLLTSHSDYTMMDIVVACGFNSRQHFFRTFKLETGMSPSQYRHSFFETVQINRTMSGEGERFASDIIETEATGK